MGEKEQWFQKTSEMVGCFFPYSPWQRRAAVLWTCQSSPGRVRETQMLLPGTIASPTTHRPLP